ncbi:MAG: substrate-binding domain-containing protein [Clostridia bacterium]|nr:substrate-binding domain-containing protein [Clostridia bacterium]
MKKWKGIALGAVTVGVAFGISACGGSCGGEKNIMVISRDAESGTRAAFEEIVKKDGVKLQDATLTDDMEMASGTGIVKSKVETNETAIGYISFSSLDDSVKALEVDGVYPSVATVQNGEYKMTRPFVLMTPTARELSPLAQDFFNFCMSTDAQDEIAAAGCIESSREFTTYSTAEATLSGTIRVEGSTSMQDIMDALIGEYKKVQPSVTVTPTYNGSSNGRSAVENDTTGNTIGLASSSKQNDKYEQHTLCIDAIAVIVHKENTLDGLTVEQLFDIYTGEITKFSEIAG